MAAAVVQGVTLNKILQCSICINVFTDPRTLPCLHTFCCKCIADWCKDSLPGEEVTCPECREEFVIPDSGISGLKKNFFVANLLTINKTQQKTEVMCEICVGDDKNVSEMFCLQCEQSYCESCSKSHIKTKICNSHKLVRLDELQSGVDVNKKYRLQYCDKHTDKLIEMYCLDDEVAICMMCCVLNHRSHRCEETKNIANQFRTGKWKQDLQTALSEVEDKFRVLNFEKLNFSEKTKIVENEIRKEAYRKIQLIKDHKRKLFYELGKIKTHHEREIYEVNQELVRAKALLSTLKDYCDELLKIGSDADICLEKNSLCRKTEELVNLTNLDESLEKLGVTNVIFSSSSATFGGTKSACGELEAVKSGLFNESEDEMMLEGTSTVTDESGEFSELKHNCMLPVTHTVTDNPQLWFTFDQPPTDSKRRPRPVMGVAMLDKYLYVIYFGYNTVHVFSCEDRFRNKRDIEVNEICCPFDMVGCSVTSQLFVSDRFDGNIWRVNVNTGVSDVFIKLGDNYKSLSLVENRLLLTSDNSLLMYDIHSGHRTKKIPLTGVLTAVRHAIESNRNSFFVCHEQSNGRTYTVSEIDSEGRVIRVFDNKEQFNCRHLELDSVGRLLVADFDRPTSNYSVVLLDEHLAFLKNLLVREQLDDAQPVRLSYNKNNNRLAVGLDNGHVKIFDCHV